MKTISFPLASIVCLLFVACESSSFHDIEGTASGIDGVVILRNNGGDDLSISKNGKFSFETAVVEGQPYHVTLHASPPTQVCTVSHGKGIVTKSVTDLKLVCSSISNHVGGKVSGLSGGTLTLQNNDGDDLVIATNGDFLFNTAVANGADYDVTIASKPSNQNCSVTHGQGTISGKEISNVRVVCSNKVTTNPTSLADHFSFGMTTVYPYFSRVAMDDKGNTVVAWIQDIGSSNAGVFRSEYRNGAWKHPTSLSDAILTGVGTGYADPLSVAMDNNGNAIMVWTQYDGVDYRVFKSEYRNGTWSDPAGISDYISPNGGGSAQFSQVAMDDNGNAIIVWQQGVGMQFRLFKSEYRAGVWHHPVDINDNFAIGAPSALLPKVAMDNNGNAIITWYQYDGANDQIYKREYRGGSWHDPSGITDHISPAGTDATIPKVAMDNNGNAIIIWSQVDGSGNSQVFKSEYRSGAWIHPANNNINISPNGTNGGFDETSVAMDDNGNAIIVWEQNDGSNLQVYKSEYRSGAWSHPTGLSDHLIPSALDANNPQVSMDNNGNAMIAWTAFDNLTEDQTFKATYRNGAWTYPSSLTDHVSFAGTQNFPVATAMSDNGDAIIVWAQHFVLFGPEEGLFKSEYR